jgi:hypothetical protein
LIRGQDGINRTVLKLHLDTKEDHFCGSNIYFYHTFDYPWSFLHGDGVQQSSAIRTGNHEHSLGNGESESKINNHPAILQYHSVRQGDSKSTHRP